MTIKSGSVFCSQTDVAQVDASALHCTHRLFGWPYCIDYLFLNSRIASFIYVWMAVLHHLYMFGWPYCIVYICLDGRIASFIYVWMAVLHRLYMFVDGRIASFIYVWMAVLHRRLARPVRSMLHSNRF